MDKVFLLVALFFSTFILEDATAYWGATLASVEVLPFWLSYGAVSLGIFVGDLLLYILGLHGEKIKYLGKIVKKLHTKIEKHSLYYLVSYFLNNKFIISIVISRFVPGLRLPLYYLSGKLKKNFHLFSFLSLFLVLIWTYALFTGLSFIRQKIELFSELSTLQIFFVLLFIFLIIGKFLNILVYSLIDKAYYYKLLSYRYFEFWSPNVFYLPVVFFYIYFLFRFRLLPTSISCVNPCFDYGGLSFDSKYKMLEKFQDYKEYFAKTIYISKNTPIDEINLIKILDSMNLTFPLIAKPDKGHRGQGVKKVYNIYELITYLENSPNEVVVQEYIDYPFEYGVFWFKVSENPGVINSITRKRNAIVIGDGKSTLKDLILKDKRARYLANVYFERNKKFLNTIPSKNEVFSLGIAGNHCQGAIFEDGIQDLSKETLEKIKQISESVNGFDFGRYDIKFQDIHSKEKQRNFKIIEVNGTEAEMTHIYDRQYTLLDAYKTLFYQWKTLFIIAKKNMQAGIRPIPPLKLLKLYSDFFLKEQNNTLSD